jgi:membrane fusion protein, copper/silver efflux system
MMRKAILSAALVAAGFIGGYALHRPSADPPAAAARKILYYHCPMHPAYKSDRPGSAPCCGMEMVPVYAGEAVPAAAGADVPGAVRISAERQQMVGLRTAKVERTSGLHTIRALGRVAADETRIRRITALVEGVVRSVCPWAAGDLVRKDEVLATSFVSVRDIYAAMQNYFLALSAVDQGLERSGDKSLIDSSQAQVRLNEELLKTYGLTEAQMRNLARTRQITRDIEFRSPVDGIVLARSVSLDQRVERGYELFRIADLSKVWVLADLFENESGQVQPGSAVRVRYQGRSHRAVVTQARQFDPAARTMRVRLDLDNPGLVLRPDMFVDVEFDVQEPEGISVPVDAVLDSGRRKAVFVSSGDGVFEPREVIAGSRFGDRVHIVKGIDEGDSVVVSGLFLLDSESRLQLSASRAAGMPAPASSSASVTTAAKTIDPVCGMEVDPSSAAYRSEYQGATWYFCSRECKTKFDAAPAKYAPRKATPSGA